MTQQANVFNQQAVRHDKAATSWLRATIAFSVIATVAVFVLFFVVDHPSASASNGEIATNISGRVVGSTLALFAVAFAARNYVTHRHNQVINEHRRNALQTFQVFAESSRDDATRDAVLLEATRSIFTPQDSGYIRHGAGEGVPTSALLEVVQRGAHRP